MTAADTTLARRSNQVVRTFIIGLLLIDLAWLPFSAIRLNAASLLVPLVAALVLAFVAHVYRERRAEHKIADGLDCSAQMIGFFAVGALFSYLLASLGFPLQDSVLYDVDRALGLDWMAYLKAVNQRPLLGLLFQLAYDSFIPQVLILIVTLSFTGRGSAARVMILAMILAGLVTILISGFFPAMAMFVHLNLTPADFPHLSPSAAFVHVHDMQALRAGAPFDLDLSKAQGIITFPSYHAALGLLMLLGGLAHPVLRWPVVALNLTMIAATPIDGGHYFVDVGAGLIIAGACYLLAHRLLQPTYGAAVRFVPVVATAEVAES